MKKREPSYTVGSKVSWKQIQGKTAWTFLKKLKIQLPDDRAVLLLDIYPEKKL